MHFTPPAKRVPTHNRTYTHPPLPLPEPNRPPTHPTTPLPSPHPADLEQTDGLGVPPRGTHARDQMRRQAEATQVDPSQEDAQDGTTPVSEEEVEEVGTDLGDLFDEIDMDEAEGVIEAFAQAHADREAERGAFSDTKVDEPHTIVAFRAPGAGPWDHDSFSETLLPKVPADLRIILTWSADPSSKVTICQMTVDYRLVNKIMSIPTAERHGWIFCDKTAAEAGAI